MAITSMKTFAILRSFVCLKLDLDLEFGLHQARILEIQHITKCFSPFPNIAIGVPVHASLFANLYGQQSTRGCKKVTQHTL